MPDYSIFDIAGPVMVGPSSSHTAGACKIGQMARALFHEVPTKVTFYLHGSFAEVYKGHATDRALLGGVLGFRTSDPRIKNSFKLAEEQGLEYRFLVADLGEDAHPNTVKIVLENRNSLMTVVGSSIGGGMIEISQIDNFQVHITGMAGKHQSILLCHDQNPAVIKEVISHIEDLQIQVVEIKESNYRKKSISIVSLDGKRIRLGQVKDLENIAGVDFVRPLSHLQK